MVKRIALVETNGAGSGYALSRFNAVKHGILSKTTVLSWEDAEEFQDFHATLVEEHDPVGPTEEYLVEELVGIFWRKRRLRMAEMAAVQQGLLEAANSSDSTTAAAALVCTSDPAGGEAVKEALRATSEDLAEEVRVNDEACEQARKALQILKRGNEDAYERAIEALKSDTVARLKQTPEKPTQTLEEIAKRIHANEPKNLAKWLEQEELPYFAKRRAELTHRDAIRRQAFGAAVVPERLEKLSRYETHLARMFERTLAMLVKWQQLRREQETDE